MFVEWMVVYYVKRCVGIVRWLLNETFGCKVGRIVLLYYTYLGTASTEGETLGGHKGRMDNE